MNVSFTDIELKFSLELYYCLNLMNPQSLPKDVSKIYPETKRLNPRCEAQKSRKLNLSLRPHCKNMFMLSSNFSDFLHKSKVNIEFFNPCAHYRRQNLLVSAPTERDEPTARWWSVCTQSFGKHNYSPSPRLWNCCTTAVKHAAVIITDKSCTGPRLPSQYSRQTTPCRSNHLVTEWY